MSALNITSGKIVFPCSDSFEMSAYVARPTGEGSFPAIVFMFEILGLNKEMMRLADEIAAAGYVVIIPDLYNRGNLFMCIVKLFKDLKAGGGTTADDLLAARKWLTLQSFADAERIAVMGLCIGGGFALLLAKTGLFKAAADFYGMPPKTLNGACPVIASIGAKDKTVMPTVPAFKAELERLNIPNDVKIYSDTGHAFMNKMPNKLLAAVMRLTPAHAAYNPDAAADAMNRLLHFLALHV